MKHASWQLLLPFLLLSVWGGCIQTSPPEPPSSEARAQPLAPALDLAKIEHWVRIYVNQTREAHLLNTLDRHDKLAKVARHHSQDMAEHDYFDHVNQSGERPLHRARQEGISCAISENLYQTYQYESYRTIYSGGSVEVRYEWKDERRIAEDTIQGWLDSPPHRAALLNPRYSFQGIGVAMSLGLKIFVTQNLC